MVEDVGEEMDLASLADSLPITEDLLEQDDDAPIVRLINALLSEAIRARALTSIWKHSRESSLFDSA